VRLGAWAREYVSGAFVERLMRYEAIGVHCERPRRCRGDHDGRTSREDPYRSLWVASAHVVSPSHAPTEVSTCRTAR